MSSLRLENDESSSSLTSEGSVTDKNEEKGHSGSGKDNNKTKPKILESFRTHSRIRRIDDEDDDNEEDDKVSENEFSLMNNRLDSETSYNEVYVYNPLVASRVKDEDVENDDNYSEGLELDDLDYKFCDDCKQSFVSKSDLQRHIESTKHKSQLSSRCFLCKQIVHDSLV